MAASATILMSLKTVGADESKLKFAAVAAAVVALGVKINKVREEAQSFALKWNAMDKEMRGYALTMDSVGKGMIDTGLALKSIAELGQAGVKVTHELSSAIGRLAVEKGIALGETFEEIQSRVIALTNAISKGQTRALKAYGIDLDNTEDLLLSQAEASEKVIKRAQGLTVELKNVDHSLAALNNDWETGIGLATAYSETFKDLPGLLGMFAENLAETNKVIQETDGLLSDVVAEEASFYNFTRFVAEALRGRVKSHDEVTDALHRQIRAQLQLRALEAESAQAKADAAKAAQWEKDIAERRAQQAFDVELDAIMRGEYGMQTGVTEWTQTGGDIAGYQAGLEMTAEAGKGARGGGGGRRRELSEEEKEFMRLYGMKMGEVFRANFLIAGWGRGLAPTSADMELLGGAPSAEAEAWAAGTGEMRTKTEITAAEIEADNAKWEFLRNSTQNYWMWEEEAKSEHIARMVDLDRSGVRASQDMWETSLQTRMQMFSGFFGNVGLLMQTENKKAFKVGQAAAIAKATIDTATGAIAAYQAMAGIPYVGPALGAVAAAAVTAYGFAMIAKIKNTKFGGGFEGGGGWVGGGGGTSSYGEGGGYGGTGYGMGGGQGGVTHIHLDLDGEQIHEVIVNQNDKADQQGKRSFKA